MLLRKIAATLLRAAPVIALLSSPARGAAGWGTAMTVQSFIPTATDLTIVVVSNGSNPMGCGTAHWLRMSTTDANYALVSSAILTAFSQGKAVQVWQDSCNADGSVHFIGVWINQ